jgi:hypothetical protein
MCRKRCAIREAILLVAFGLVIGVLSSAAGQPDQDKDRPPPVNLSGTWDCDDDATYYVRQVGNVVWWTGISKKGNGEHFTNVFRGVIEVNSKVKLGDPGRFTLQGTWADVRGKFNGNGTLTVEIYPPNEAGVVAEFRRASAGDGFTGKVWKRAAR